MLNNNKAVVFRFVFIIIFLAAIFVIVALLSSNVFQRFTMSSKDIECSNLLSMADVYISNGKENEFNSLFESVCKTKDIGSISDSRFYSEIQTCLEKGSNLMSESTFLNRYPNFCIECMSYELESEVSKEELEDNLQKIGDSYEIENSNFAQDRESNILVTFSNENTINIQTSSQSCGE